MAAGDIQLEREVVKQRLETLVHLQEYVTMLRDSLQDLLGRQTTGTWSDAGATGQFVALYRRQLRSLDTELAQIRTQLNEYHAALHANMSALVSTDADVQQRLLQVAARLNASPHGATPPPGVQDSAPADPSSAPITRHVG
ncbi:hypothetical protein [Cellulomonas sp. ICMP 17802]|uniref:hypothetical protein n=1 Tax=Cellulomonas sp. ICMP 17802 TaxID=3239199 RepID=UPI00351B168B